MPLCICARVLASSSHLQVWAKDQDGYVVACATFTGSDPKAELVFDLPANATAITAFECCNLYGVWASVPISV